MGGAWAQTPTPPANGNGDVDTPYIITKAEELAWFRNQVNGGKNKICAKIADNVEVIDLKDFCHAEDVSQNLKELSWVPIGTANKPYKGTFDGNNKTITNLYIKTAHNDVGFFCMIMGATIQDLIFDNAKVENVSTTYTKALCTGILAGGSDAGTNPPSHIKGIKTTKNCTVIGQNDTGGIVGNACNINIENCENRSSVKGESYVGGIAGNYYYKNIKRCTNYGTVETVKNNSQRTGGIIGYANGTSIEDCANYGKLTSKGCYYGGIAGEMRGNSSIQNVFSYGDMTYTYAPGIIIGYVDRNSTLTAKGIVAYNKEALLNNSSENIKIVGTGSLTFEDGKEEADVVKAFTKQQIKSGEVAYLLNGSTSEGELAWYQKLGTDAYPVLTAAEGNTVYHGSFRYCDNTTASYSNSSSENELVHVASATLASPEHDADEHIYNMGCRNEKCAAHKYVADKAGNIVVTKDANNKFVAAEDLTLADGEDFKDYEAFTSKTISYSRNIPEGAAWGTLCLPFAIDLSQEAECDFYRLTGIDAAKECITIESCAEGVIPAGTPVLFKMKEGETVLSLSAVGADIVTAPLSGTSSDVNLVGSFTQISGENLAASDYVIGEDQFCRVSDLHDATILPMRAYLHLSDASLTTAAKLSIGKNDGSTAIDHLNAISRDADAEYYDASGRRTHGLQKGLNIVKHDGKTYKIMVK